MTRRFLSRAHRWLGVCLGGPFALIGLTGSLLIFYVEIDRAVHPALHAPEPSRATSSPNWDQAVSTLRRTYPDKQGPWRLEVTPDQRFIPARYYDPPERAGQAFAPMLVWLSADGTHVLRHDYWGDTAMTWLYDLHYRLMLGEAGAILIGLEGLALIFALLIGMVLWWPRGSWAKALRYKSQAAPSRRLRDQHKLLGLASIVPLLLLAGTGAMLALPGPTAGLLSTLGLVTTVPARPVSAGWSGRQISVQHAVAIGQQHWPEARLAWIEVPGPGNAAFALRVQLPGDPSRRFPHSYIWIDQYRGTILGTQDLRNSGGGARILAWLHPLHDGSAGGMWLRCFFVLAGVMPLALWWTGRGRAQLRTRARNGSHR